MPTEWLVSLYIGLARALAADIRWPDWLTAAGRDWPLWLPLTRLAAQDGRSSLKEAVLALSEVPSSSKDKRMAAFCSLFAGNGHSPIFLYESQFLGGRLLGEESLMLGKMYGRLGLEVDGAELPDHASVELEFLAYLAEKEAASPEQASTWRAAQSLFIRQHAGRWLPEVGRNLATSTDPAWSAIGVLLIAVLTPVRSGHRPNKARSRLPQITDADSCSLCGFCAQTCPTAALKIHEDAKTTQLWLVPDLCVHCRKCERVCDDSALTMTGSSADPGPVLIRQSARAVCPVCGTATVSEAELKAVARRLNSRPDWLELCMECRALDF